MSSITPASCNLHSDDSSSSRVCKTSGLHRNQETTTSSGPRLPGGPQGAAPREPQAVQQGLRLPWLLRGAEQGQCLTCPCLPPISGSRLSPKHPLPGALHAAFPFTCFSQACLSKPAAPVMLGDVDSVSRAIQSSLKLLFNET